MFFDRLEAACILRGTKVATAVKAAGGSTGSIDAWKKGKSIPRSDIVIGLAHYLGVTTDYLLEMSDDSSKQNTITEHEIEMINQLRDTPPIVQEAISSMLCAITSTLKDNTNNAISFSQSDSKDYHIKRKNATRKKQVLGKAAAGIPITTVPDSDTFISVPKKYLDRRFFIVQARGESMIEAHIPDGAYCVFNSEGHRDDGSIVIAQVDGPTDQPEGTIKRLYLHGDEIELRPANPDFKPMFFPAESVRITGVLVDVLLPDDA